MRAVRPSSVIFLPLNDAFWFHIFSRFLYIFIWNFKRSGPFLSLLPVTGFITFSTLFASKEIMIRVKIAQISVQRQTQKYDPCKSWWNIWTTVPTRNCTEGLYSSIFFGWLGMTTVLCFCVGQSMYKHRLFLLPCCSFHYRPLHKILFFLEQGMCDSNIGIAAIKVHTLKSMQNANTNTKLPSDMKVAPRYTLFTLFILFCFTAYTACMYANTYC